MIRAERRDFARERPDETDAIFHRSGDEAVVVIAGQSAFGCDGSVHNTILPGARPVGNALLSRSSGIVHSDIAIVQLTSAQRFRSAEESVRIIAKTFGDPLQRKHVCALQKDLTAR